MPPKIIDEFTNLNISPTQKYQLRHRRDGKCMHCASPISENNKSYCESHRLKNNDRMNSRNKNDHQKYSARYKLANAINLGRIKRRKCMIRGCKLLGEGHHTDYSKPFLVKWLCKKHHLAAHGKTLRIKRPTHTLV